MSPRSELRNLLATVRSQATSTSDLGHRFELLTRAALTAHDGPQGTQRFETVWLWRDWPGRRETDGVDVGIDLVARQTAAYGGGFCAIQCKFLAGGQVTTRAVDSFLAASSRVEFTHRLLVTTAGSVQRHGATKLMHAHPPCDVFALNDMASWNVDWWRLGVATGVLDPEVGRPRVVRDSFRGRRQRRQRGLIATWFDWVERRWRAERVWWKQQLMRLYLVLEVSLGLALMLMVAALVLVVFVGVWLLMGGSKKNRRRR